MAAATGLSARILHGWRRLHGAGRLQGVDLARGLAVVGMLAAHLVDIPEFAWGDPATWGGVVHGRSSIVFATVAGLSIGLATGGTRPLEARPLALARRRIALRAAIIWTIGVGLMATGVPVYVILPAYAILFLLTLPLLRVRASSLFIAAAALAVVTPLVHTVIESLPWRWTEAGDAAALAIGWHYPFLVWIVFVMAGLGMARSDLSRTSVVGLFAVAGTGLTVVGYALPLLAPSSGADADWWMSALSADAHSSGIGEVVGSGGFAIAVVALCILLCRTPATLVVLPLRATGSMPLTAYAGQIVAWWILALASGLTPGDLFGVRAMDPLVPFVVATLVGCTVWALTIGRGPLEWAIDRLARFVR